jgi:hypothetical protein
VSIQRKNNWLETSQSLKRFELQSVRDVRIVGRFLLSASKNSSIKEIRLITVTIPADSLIGFICCSKALTKLMMGWKAITETPAEEISGQTLVVRQQNVRPLCVGDDSMDQGQITSTTYPSSGEEQQHNHSVVEFLQIDDSVLTLTHNGELDPLYEFIEKSRCLLRFELTSVTNNANLVDNMLLALSKSSSIKELLLNEMVVPVDSLKHLLCHMESLTKHEMVSTLIEESTNGVGEAQVAVSFSQNKSIEKLELFSVVEESFFVQLLKQCEGQSTFKRLVDMRILS